MTEGLIVPSCQEPSEQDGVIDETISEERHGRQQADRGQRSQRCRPEALAYKKKIGGATGYTKRDRSSGEFMAVKKPTKVKKAAKKFKGVRVEKKASKK